MAKQPKKAGGKQAPSASGRKGAAGPARKAAGARRGTGARKAGGGRGPKPEQPPQPVLERAPAPAVDLAPVLERPLPLTLPAQETALLAETRALLEAPPQPCYTAAALDRMRDTLGAHQAKVAERMQRILNGQNLTLADVKLPQEDDPSEPPLERLRRYMGVLQAARQRMRTPAFGLCELCERPIGEAPLLHKPWLTRCDACGARDARLSALQAFDPSAGS